MGVGAIAFPLALLVTVTVAVPLAIATTLQMHTRGATWLKEHARSIWLAVALVWLASLARELPDAESYMQLEIVASALGVLCAVGAASIGAPRATRDSIARERAAQRNETGGRAS